MELTHKVVTFAQHNTMHLYRNKRELATACSQRQNKHQKKPLNALGDEFLGAVRRESGDSCEKKAQLVTGANHVSPAH